MISNLKFVTNLRIIFNTFKLFNVSMMKTKC